MNGHLLVLLVFITIPLGTTVLMFFKKREHLWLSPVLVFVLGTIASIIIEPRIMDTFRVVFFSGYSDGSSTRTAMTVLLVPLLVSVFCVVICKAAEAVKMRGV